MFINNNITRNTITVYNIIQLFNTIITVYNIIQLFYFK